MHESRCSPAQPLTVLLNWPNHAQIDVTNPCLVMTQDKSRQFLHSNGPGDKFQVRRCRTSAPFETFGRHA